MESATPPESASSNSGKGKSASAFRTISEVANELDLPQHVLRFWETKFQNIKPLKRGGGRRYYRPEEIALLKQIRDLLYNDGYTIKGVQKLFRENDWKIALSPQLASDLHTKPMQVETSTDTAEVQGTVRIELQSILSELEELRRLLKAS